MKKGFQRLLQVPLLEPDEEETDKDDEEDEEAAAAKLEMARDPLKEELRTRQKAALSFCTNAAKLIAPVLDASDWQAGYDWVIEQLKRDHASVASELQICKALEYMSHKEFDRAIEELKAFEKKDVRLKARAATNLSFLYFLEGVSHHIQQITMYAMTAVCTCVYVLPCCRTCCKQASMLIWQ
jgi:intraflagellar transport protein 88